jgi:hypothetical protein
VDADKDEVNLLLRLAIVPYGYSTAVAHSGVRQMMRSTAWRF